MFDVRCFSRYVVILGSVSLAGGCTTLSPEGPFTEVADTV